MNTQTIVLNDNKYDVQKSARLHRCIGRQTKTHPGPASLDLRWGCLCLNCRCWLWFVDAGKVLTSIRLSRDDVMPGWACRRRAADTKAPQGTLHRTWGLVILASPLFERLSIILRATQSARPTPPAIFCPCDVLGRGADGLLRGRPISLQSLCFYARCCDRAGGQPGEGERCTSCTLSWPVDTSRVRSSRPCLARHGLLLQSLLCRCARQHRLLPPDVLWHPEHAGRPCARLLRGHSCVSLGTHRRAAQLSQHGAHAAPRRRCLADVGERYPQYAHKGLALLCVDMGRCTSPDRCVCINGCTRQPRFTALRGVFTYTIVAQVSLLVLPFFCVPIIVHGSFVSLFLSMFIRHFCFFPRPVWSRSLSLPPLTVSPPCLEVMRDQHDLPARNRNRPEWQFCRDWPQ